MEGGGVWGGGGGGGVGGGGGGGTEVEIRIKCWPVIYVLAL